MVRIKSVDELILNAIDFYRTAQPDLDTKPGTVSRDILIDGPSTQLSLVYQELANVKAAQSIRLAIGSDLDKLGSNYRLSRRLGSVSSGVAIYTFNEIEADIPINSGDIVTANNGSSFTVNQSMTITPVNINQYRAIASKYRANLDFVGITDEYAVEVSVVATAPGILGNISRYSLSTTSTPGVSNVTNIQPFGGGSAAENDQSFRNRILSIFSGANTGTALGYKNAVLSDPQVIDAIVIEPGDELMTRDGTQVFTDEDGTKTIISEGTGGKVDVIVQGFRLQNILDSFIYRDKSNKNDPTDPINDFVLGQIEGDENKSISKRRIDNIKNNILPDQPVNNIVEVVGSSSGSNFIPKTIDNLGRVSGNYELIKDSGPFGGSPFGFDRLHFIDNQIRDYGEDQTKGRFNGQDSLSFSDVKKIGKITQNIQIINESGKVNANNRNSIQLAHKPITSVTRVLNLTTGERYIVTNQNPDGTGSINTTGRITISGNTLPSISDILQIDYVWICDFDSDFDFDNKTSTSPRDNVDSVDWGFSNAVLREESIIELSGNLLLVNVTHPISSVISINTFANYSSTVSLISGRLGVIVDQSVYNVISVVDSSSNLELFDTTKKDGSFSGLTIFLPTDTTAQVGDLVSVTYNANDIFTIDGVTGSYNENEITLPINAEAPGTIVEVNYISNIRTLLPQTLLTSLPAIKNENGFSTLDSSFVGTQPTTHIFNNNEIIKNLRKAPSRLQLTISGAISPGTITVSGTTFNKVIDAVFTVSSDGLKHNLSGLIRNHLNISSTSSIPSNIYVSRITKVEKVRTTSSFDVLDVEYSYSVKGYAINNNKFVKSDSINNNLLSKTEFELPETSGNIDNEPKIGDRLRVTFHIATENDSENVSFSKSGTLFTQKTFALIDSVNISSGFTSGASQTATITINNLNQPSSGSRYNVKYDYIAPKPNERITIRYNKNSVISDATFAIEKTRPISADVLVKEAKAITVDVIFAVVVTKGFQSSASVVRQNVIDAITSALSANSLGQIVDESDLINVAYEVDGVDRVRPIFFNVSGKTGRVLSIVAQKNEYIQAGSILVDIETR